VLYGLLAAEHPLLHLHPAGAAPLLHGLSPQPTAGLSNQTDLHKSMLHDMMHAPAAAQCRCDHEKPPDEEVCSPDGG
jgi:hypothetical protein